MSQISSADSECRGRRYRNAVKEVIDFTAAHSQSWHDVDGISKLAIKTETDLWDLRFYSFPLLPPFDFAIENKLWWRGKIDTVKFTTDAAN